jgi:hypothetical protein
MRKAQYLTVGDTKGLTRGSVIRAGDEDALIRKVSDRIGAARVKVRPVRWHDRARWQVKRQFRHLADVWYDLVVRACDRSGHRLTRHRRLGIHAVVECWCGERQEGPEWQE